MIRHKAEQKEQALVAKKSGMPTCVVAWLWRVIEEHGDPMNGPNVGDALDLKPSQ